MHCKFGASQGYTVRQCERGEGKEDEEDREEGKRPCLSASVHQSPAILSTHTVRRDRACATLPHQVPQLELCFVQIPPTLH